MSPPCDASSSVRFSHFKFIKSFLQFWLRTFMNFRNLFMPSCAYSFVSQPLSAKALIGSSWFHHLLRQFRLKNSRS